MRAVVFIVLLIIGLVLGAALGYNYAVSKLQPKILELQSQIERYRGEIKSLEAELEKPIKCEDCHGLARDLHAGKEAFCATCHAGAVHDIHAERVNCESCHLVGGRVVVPKGGESCKQCHGDNLVEIHIERGAGSCEACHGSLQQVHARAAAALAKR